MPRLKHLLSSPLQKKFSDPALVCKLHHGRDFHLFCSLLYSWYLERRLVHSRYSILVHWIKYKVEIPWKVLLLSLKFQSLSGFWFFTQIPEIFIVRQISPFHIFTALKKKAFSPIYLEIQLSYTFQFLLRAILQYLSLVYTPSWCQNQKDLLPAWIWGKREESRIWSGFLA